MGPNAYIYIIIGTNKFSDSTYYVKNILNTFIKIILIRHEKKNIEERYIVPLLKLLLYFIFK